MLIHCGNLSFSFFFPYYSNIEILTVYSIPVYFEKVKMDWEEYIKEKSCLRILQDLLFAANTYQLPP